MQTDESPGAGGVAPCDLELYSYTRGNQVRSFKAAD